MIRVDSNRPNDIFQNRMRDQDYRLDQLSRSISSGRRINNLRDDPLSASRATRLASILSRLDQFSDTVTRTQGRYALVEGYMGEAKEILQRIRELSVQGAHGTYNPDDLRIMGGEVNELLKELLTISNARSEEGRALFGGTRTSIQPFRALQGRVPALTGEAIVGVEYAGVIEENLVEADQEVLFSPQFPGNHLFWAEDQEIYSSVNGNDYRVPESASFFIDGKEIRAETGDNLLAIVERINASGAAVKASQDPVTGGLVLRTTVPHQLWLEEGPNGRVLSDLGILSPAGSGPPSNLNPTALVGGGSLFDTVIRLRDFLLAGDHESVGGRGLQGIDQALGRVVDTLAELGSRDERATLTLTRLEYEDEVFSTLEARTVDADMAKVITDLKELEYLQRASYQAAGRVLRPTLLDFLGR